ncbi:MAG: hypothetical protein U1E40_14165 [Amaricoccus sp.]
MNWIWLTLKIPEVDQAAEGRLCRLTVEADERAEEETEAAVSPDRVETRLVADALRQEHPLELGDVARGELLGAPHLQEREVIGVGFEKPADLHPEPA